MTFQHPLYLIGLCGLPLIVFLFYLYLNWKKQKIKKIGDAALVKQLTYSYSPQKFFVKAIFTCAAYTLLVLALANPRKTEGNSNIKHSGIDVMIALDVSKSMLAQDIQPSRLEKARQFVSKLVDKIPDNRVGLVLFAGRAYMQMPLTSDLAAAKLYLSAADPEVIPTQGTVIGDALQMCYNAFNAKEKKYKSIIVISDGEDHDEGAQKLSRSLAEEGVMINTIGIGSAEGTTINNPVTGEPKKDAEGKTVITKLNETLLKDIAAATGGIYKQLSNTDETVSAVSQQLNTMEKRGITEISTASFRYYFQWLIALGLLFLLLDFFMAETKNTGRVKLQKAVALLLFFSFSLPLAAQNTNQVINQGNELYREKKFSKAAEKYQKAITRKPGEATAHYNLGNALYKNNNADSALAAFDKAIAFAKTNSEKAGAWYNKGVVLQNNNKLKDCIEAYKNALKLDPSDEAARLNLQKAIKQQQQQEQQKQDQKKKEEKKKPQQQQQKQPKPQQSKISKREAEEKLQALLQQEKNLQDKLKKTDAPAAGKPDKDW